MTPTPSQAPDKAGVVERLARDFIDGHGWSPSVLPELLAFARTVAALSPPPIMGEGLVEQVAELQLAAFLAGRGSTRKGGPLPTMEDWLRLATTALATPSLPEGMADFVAERVVRDVCELPDRTSPEDAPDMCLVTVGELDLIVRDALAAAPFPEGMD